MAKQFGVVKRKEKIIKYLYEKKRVTMLESASEFSVDLRTIERDIVELIRYFPIRTVQGRNGGVYLDEEFILYKLTEA